jgi:hypothetical protein
VVLGKEYRHREDPETGLPLEHEPPVESEIYEIRAKGAKACQALKGEMKDSSQTVMQQAYNRDRKYGVEVLSDPNGKPVPVLGTEVDRYRAAGYGVKGLKTVMRVNGFGGMQREGIRRQRIGRHFTETWYRDGRYVREERSDAGQ